MRIPFMLLGVAGVALYGSYSHFTAPSGRLAQLAQVSEIVTGGGGSATMTDATAAGPRVFSPQKPLMAQAVEPTGRKVAETVHPGPVPPMPVQVTRRSDPFGEAPAIQAVQPKAQPQTSAAASQARKGATGSGRPANEEARATLVRDLQRELKRVGCFDGELSGWWNQGTRRAMGAFTERVNATLPIDEPDYILLALLQSQQGQVCGGCPSGQAASGDGRCAPRAILAQADNKKGRAAETRETPAEADRRLQQSAAALAGQLASAPVPAARGKSWETGVFPAAPQPVPAARPAQAATPTAPAPVVASAPVADPLPGRMGIGAPVTAQPDARLAPPTTTASLPAPTEIDPTQAGQPWPGGPGVLPAPRTATPQKRPPPPRFVEYQPAPRVYYASPPPSRSRGPGPNLRGQQNVKDFFFGAGRGSF